MYFVLELSDFSLCLRDRDLYTIMYICIIDQGEVKMTGYCAKFFFGFYGPQLHLDP